MQPLSPRLSGRILTSQMAAVGLATALSESGEQVFIGHDQESLDLSPQVWTDATPERIAAAIGEQARACAAAIGADLRPGKPRNDQQPVIWARATARERSEQALKERERLLDDHEPAGRRLPIALVQGLGAPAAWLEKPSRGASAFDGVIGNRTSDFVRGVFRPTLPVAINATPADLAAGWTGTALAPSTGGFDESSAGVWEPESVRVPHLTRWLSALALAEFPPGLSSQGRAATPCHWAKGSAAGVTLPVLEAPVSLTRYRAIVRLPAFTVAPPDEGAPLSSPAAARLRALGIRELLVFTRLDRSTQRSVRFTFTPGRRIEL